MLAYPGGTRGGNDSHPFRQWECMTFLWMMRHIPWSCQGFPSRGHQQLPIESLEQELVSSTNFLSMLYWEVGTNTLGDSLPPHTHWRHRGAVSPSFCCFAQVKYDRLMQSVIFGLRVHLLPVVKSTMDRMKVKKNWKRKKESKSLMDTPNDIPYEGHLCPVIHWPTE